MQKPEFQWLGKHSKELEKKYPGKVVAIVDNKVMGVGDTIQEPERKARRITRKKPFFGQIRSRKAMII